MEFFDTTKTIPLQTFDNARAKTILKLCDMIFGGRDKYEWDILDKDPLRPAIKVKYTSPVLKTSISANLSCYNLKNLC